MWIAVDQCSYLRSGLSHCFGVVWVWTLSFSHLHVEELLETPSLEMVTFLVKPTPRGASPFLGGTRLGHLGGGSYEIKERDGCWSELQRRGDDEYCRARDRVRAVERGQTRYVRTPAETRKIVILLTTRS